MSKKSANESLPDQPVGQGLAGTAAAQPSQESPKAPEDAMSSVPPPASSPWGDPRPRRRQDREAGPSEKQVYVPPVTLPPNREHHTIDQQKIQVAPAVLKGVDERNRPTMRKIQMSGGTPSPPGIGADAGSTASHTVGGRTARFDVDVGRGVWPPPDDQAQAGAQRLNGPRASWRQAVALPVDPVIASADAGSSPQAPEQNPNALLVSARKPRVPVARLGLVALLSCGTAAGIAVFYQRSVMQRNQVAEPPLDEAPAPSLPVGQAPPTEPPAASTAPLSASEVVPVPPDAALAAERALPGAAASAVQAPAPTEPEVPVPPPVPTMRIATPRLYSTKPLRVPPEGALSAPAPRVFPPRSPSATTTAPQRAAVQPLLPLQPLEPSQNSPTSPTSTAPPRPF